MQDKQRGDFADLLECHNLCQHVVQEPHRDHHTIDLIISRNDDELIRSTRVDNLLSDHYAVH